VPPAPTELFISHGDEDRDFVSRLAEVLQRHGVPHWYSKRILGAQPWHDEIGTALARCEWFLLVLTPEAIESKWVKRELLYALRAKHYGDRIIPLLLRPCDPEKLSWTLAGFQLVDFTQSFDAGCRDLLRIWGIGYAPAPSS
jgi:hypothetical protein